MNEFDSKQHSRKSIGGNPSIMLSVSKIFSRIMSDTNEKTNKKPRSVINPSPLQSKNHSFPKRTTLNLQTKIRGSNRTKNDIKPSFDSSLITVHRPPSGPPKFPRFKMNMSHCDSDDEHISDEIDIIKLCNDYINGQKNNFLKRLIRFITNVMKMVLEQFSLTPSIISDQNAFILSILIDTCVETIIAVFDKSENAEIIHFLKAIIRRKHNSKQTSLKLIITSQVILNLLSKEQNIKTLDRTIISSINQTTRKHIKEFKKHHLENWKLFIKKKPEIEKELQSLNKNFILNNYRKKRTIYQNF